MSNSLKNHLLEILETYDVMTNGVWDETFWIVCSYSDKISYGII